MYIRRCFALKLHKHHICQIATFSVCGSSPLMETFPTFFLLRCARDANLMQHVNRGKYGYLLYNHILNLDRPSKEKINKIKKGSAVHIHVQDCVASVSSSTSESLLLQGTGRLPSHKGIYAGKVWKRCDSTTNSSLKTFGWRQTQTYFYQTFTQH